MSKKFNRNELLAQLSAFTETWSGDKQYSATHLFKPDVVFTSSTSQSFQGAEKVNEVIWKDLEPLNEVSLINSNIIIRADAGKAIVGSYILGEVSKYAGQGIRQSALFGGIVLLEFDHGEIAPLIKEAKIQITWLKGEKTLLDHWHQPADRHWQPGDLPWSIVSELDSPWQRVPSSTLDSDDASQIAEAWYQYAWGLDLADYGLFAQCFTEDAGAELTPMGTMRGRHTLSGTLKAFRMPWPSIHHFGTPLRIKIDPGLKSASMIIGRIIPGQITYNGEQVYGAHYRIELRKNDAGCWQMSWMGYHPGWITGDYVPEQK